MYYESLDAQIKEVENKGFPASSWPMLKIGQVVYILTEKERLEAVENPDTCEHSGSRQTLHDFGYGLYALVVPGPDIEVADGLTPEEWLALRYSIGGMGGTDHFFDLLQYWELKEPNASVEIVKELPDLWESNLYGG